MTGEGPQRDTTDRCDAAAQGASMTVSSLTKRFQTGRKQSVTALEDMTLEVEPGEFVTIVGPSGCGKSTLLMIVAGLETPTNGEARLNGQLVDGPSPMLGVAFQRDNLMEWKTVLGNVLSQVDLRGWSKSEYIDRARELLHMVGLGDFEHAHPSQLSGGMRQRVALCRALVHSPRLLLLDEPFGAVDALTREQLNTDVAELCSRNGVTTLLVTHDINEAVFLGDRVVVLHPRPGRLAGIVHIDDKTPRGQEFRSSSAYLEASRQVRSILDDNAADTSRGGGER